MRSPRLRQLLHRTGWEFWLPLAVTAICFWVIGNFVAAQVLSRPYKSVNKLQADSQLNVRLTVTILSMHASIDRSEGITQVSVKTTDPNLRKLEYEFPATQAQQIEQELSAELEIPVDRVRQLISYRIKD